jgi:hypothetical protein
MNKRQTKKPRSGSVDHIVRTADGRYKELRLTRKLAMAAFCTECLGFEDNPAECTSPLCPLFPWRVKTLDTRRGNIKEIKRDGGKWGAPCQKAGYPCTIPV